MSLPIPLFDRVDVDSAPKRSILLAQAFDWYMALSNDGKIIIDTLVLNLISSLRDTHQQRRLGGELTGFSTYSALELIFALIKKEYYLTDGKLMRQEKGTASKQLVMEKTDGTDL